MGSPEQLGLFVHVQVPLLTDHEQPQVMRVLARVDVTGQGGVLQTVLPLQLA